MYFFTPHIFLFKSKNLKVNNLCASYLRAPRVFTVYISIVIFSSFSTFSAAQVAPPVDAGALQQSIEKQLPPRAPLTLPEPSDVKSDAKPQQSSDEVKVLLSGFILEGLKSLPEETIQAGLKPFIGKSFSFAELQKLCDFIADIYSQNGYRVLVTLPPQKIENGVVKFLITEAKLSKVIIDTPKGETRFSKELLESYITEAHPINQPLNLVVLDRVFYILNETPGIQIASQLEAGESAGDTLLKIDLTDTPFRQGRLEINNHGSRSTGKDQGLLALGLNNLSGVGDQLLVNVMSTEGTKYIQSSYSVPVTKNGLRLGLSGTYLDYKNIGSYVFPNGGYGSSNTLGINLAYPLLRTRQTNINSTFGYDVKNYTNKLLQTNDLISAYKIQNFSSGISANHFDNFGGGAVTSASLNLIFGSLSGTYGAHTSKNFVKTNLSLSRNQQVSDDGNTTLFVSISAQASSANLNSAEQFYLGGPYGIRAYPSSQGGGSQGALSTIELRHEFPPKILAAIFYDVGFVQQHKSTYEGWQGLTNANNSYSLRGVGLSFKWNYESWNLGFVYATQIGKNPLYSSSGAPVAVDGTNDRSRAWFTASYQF